MHQPRVSTPFPGPKAREILALDRKFMSQSMTRLYPIVAEQGCGCWISDVDGNLFLGLCRLQRAAATRADRHRDHNTESTTK
jgi:4-aminobutyrate aminotransferase